MKPIQQLAAHLEQVFGEPVALAPVERAGLPVYLGRTYAFWRGEVLGRAVLFAHAERNRAGRTPKRIAADARRLQSALAGEIVVLVFSRMETHLRRRLIESRVPFVIPGRQVFLPTIGIDLSERGLGPRRSAEEPLDWAAQVTVLRHLLWGDVEERSLRSVAVLIGYAAMTLSRAQHQLVDASIADVHRRGKAHTLHFPAEARDVWTGALPHMRSPVRRTDAVRFANGRTDALYAGLSALAHSTDLSDGELPTLAMERRRAATARREGRLRPCPDGDETDALLELWNYDPHALARGDGVDPLSLYLSVRDDPDSRTQHAASQLLEQVRW